MKNHKKQLFKVLAGSLLLTLIILQTEETSSLTAGGQEEQRIAHLEEIQPDEPMTLVFPTFLHTWGMQKAGPAHLRIFLNGRTRFDDPQGVAVTVLDAWDDPQSTGDDDEPTIYGINSGRGEIIYNTSMFSVGLYGSKGRGAGQFLEPHGVDADPAGNLVVADTGNDRIAVLFNNGRVLSHRRHLRMVGENDSLKTPYDVALVHGDGVWVSDSGNSRLVLFDLEGVSGSIIDLSGIVEIPGAIALSHPMQRWSYYRNHAFYLASRAGDILVKLDPEGNEVARVTAEDVGLDELKIRYLTTDFYSNVWATDSSADAIHKFDRNLNHLATFGSRGRKKREFEGPMGISLWRRFGQVVIVESRGAQYYWVGADAYAISAVQEGTSLTLIYTLTEHSYITVRVRYSGGGLIESYRRQFRSSGERQETVTLPQVRPLEWLELVVEPTYSSYTYREKVFHLRFREGIPN